MPLLKFEKLEYLIISKIGKNSEMNFKWTKDPRMLMNTKFLNQFQMI